MGRKIAAWVVPWGIILAGWIAGEIFWPPLMVFGVLLGGWVHSEYYAYPSHYPDKK